MDLEQIISSVQEKESRHGFDSLAPYERVVFDVNAFEAEVNNGGFHQFFFNSEADRVAEIIEALQTIGASTVAGILREACCLFPAGGPSRDRYARQEQLEKIDDERLDVLDDRFYAYPDPLSQLVMAYWQKNAKA
jgi:hypothetical protein